MLKCQPSSPLGVGEGQKFGMGFEGRGMFPRSPRLLFESALFLLALGLGATALGPADEKVADALYFGAWCAAMLLIFSLGLRLPLYLRGRLASAASPAIVAAALALVLLGNIALYRHDAHLDVTVSGRSTARCGLDLFLQ
jgi:hypothetical protein